MSHITKHYLSGFVHWLVEDFAQRRRGYGPATFAPPRLRVKIGNVLAVVEQFGMYVKPTWTVDIYVHCALG